MQHAGRVQTKNTTAPHSRAAGCQQPWQRRCSICPSHAASTARSCLRCFWRKRGGRTPNGDGPCAAKYINPALHDLSVRAAQRSLRGRPTGRHQLAQQRCSMRVVRRQHCSPLSCQLVGEAVSLGLHFVHPVRWGMRMGIKVVGEGCIKPIHSRQAQRSQAQHSVQGDTPSHKQAQHSHSL